MTQSPRLLDQLREGLRYKHYSLRIEEAWLYWLKFLFAGMCALVSCVAHNPLHQPMNHHVEAAQTQGQHEQRREAIAKFIHGSAQ